MRRNRSEDEPAPMTLGQALAAQVRLRIYPSGKRAFVLSYREAGRKRLMTLGAYGPLTLDQARDQAKLNLGEIIKGNSPLDQRKERAKAKTIGGLCNEYLTRYAPSKKSFKDDQRYIKNFVLHRWRGIRIESLKRSDIADLHHTFASRAPYAGNRLLALVRRMFNLAKLWGFVGDSNHRPQPMQRDGPVHCLEIRSATDAD